MSVRLTDFCFGIRYGARNETVLREVRLVPVALSNPCPSTAFVDLEQDSRYHEAVDFVLEEGLMNGMGGAVFAPAGTWFTDAVV